MAHETTQVLDGHDAAAPSTPQIAAPANAKPAVWSTVHPVDYRLSFRFLKRGYYLRVLAGPERRSLDRLMREKQVSLVGFATLSLLLLWSFTSLGLFVLVCLAYLIKSIVGIDLFPGPSILHGLFFE